MSPWKLIGILSKLPLDAEVTGFTGTELLVAHEGEDYAITALTSANPVWVKKQNSFAECELSMSAKLFKEWMQETTPRKERGFQGRLDAAIKEQERVQKLREGDQIDTQ